MSEVAEREKLSRLLSANPEVRHVVARALEVEEDGRARNDYYLGWEWHEIPLAAQKLRVLVEEGVIKVSYHSRSSTMYMVQDADTAREALEAIGDDTRDVEEGVIPDTLLDHIVGYDEVKHWIGKSLASDTPVHVLLVGPPATAKSMFLEALGEPAGEPVCPGRVQQPCRHRRLPDQLPAPLPDRGRAGQACPELVEGMKAEDFSVLLSLMQSGVVARLKRGMREVERMTTWVFAGCNRRDRLPPELLSRFVEFQFTPYSKEDFVGVAVAVITGQLGKDRDLARYIAEQVSQRTRDVRQAIHVAQLCDSREEVDRFEAGAEPGRML